MSIEVSRLSLLTHPGFISVQQPIYHSAEFLARKKRAEDSLLQKYVGWAQNMKSDEIMWVITSANWLTFYQRYSSNLSYPAVLREMKGILGDRMMLATDDLSQCDIELVGKNTVRVLSNATLARGFQLHQELESVAFGEMFEACATEGALGLNKNLKLENKTQLLADLTDWSLLSKTKQDNLGGAKTDWMRNLKRFSAWHRRQILKRVEVVT